MMKNKASIWDLSCADSEYLTDKFIYTLTPVVATDDSWFLLVVREAGTDGSEVLCGDRREKNYTFDLIKQYKRLEITQNNITM